MNYRNLISAAAILGLASSAQALTLQVTVENLAPVDGVLLTPMWVGFHDGSFDVFNAGEAASAGLEAIAEDGNVGPLADAFALSGAGVDGVVFGLNPAPPVFRPGDVNTFEITIDPTTQRYFSYVSMVIPSNDAFIGNDDPIALFDGDMFTALDFYIPGAAVWDAGTEVNDEIPGNTAALAQAAPNTGVDENGLVRLHPGFLDGGNVLAARPGGDFTQPFYPIARVQVEVVPEPSTIALSALGLGALGVLVWRRRRS